MDLCPSPLITKEALPLPFYTPLIMWIDQLELHPKSLEYFDRPVSKTPQKVCLRETETLIPQVLFPKTQHNDPRVKRLPGFKRLESLLKFFYMILYKWLKLSAFQLSIYKIRIIVLFSHKLYIGKSSNASAVDLCFRLERINSKYNKKKRHLPIFVIPSVLLPD